MVVGHEARHLAWEGCFNVRDLGGLPARGGRVIQRGALVRSDAVGRLTATGWEALAAYGVRTIVDLRNDDEMVADAAPRPRDIATVRSPLDGIEHRDFWDGWTGSPAFGTPAYYRPFLERFPDRAAHALAAIARARPGGVVVHCSVGRDRAGLVTLLALALAGVDAEVIAADHALSAERLRPLWAQLGVEDHAVEIDAFFAREGTTPERVIAELVELDLEGLLREGGLSASDIAALRGRMLDCKI